LSEKPWAAAKIARCRNPPPDSPDVAGPNSVGSHGLCDFDSASIEPGVGSMVVLAGVVFRYTLWIMRSPAWRHLTLGWADFLSWRNLSRKTVLIPVVWWTDTLRARPLSGIAAASAG
jgi:hypothetical protein